MPANTTRKPKGPVSEQGRANLREAALLREARKRAAKEKPLDGTCAQVREDLLPLPAVSQPMPPTLEERQADIVALGQKLAQEKAQEASSLAAQHARTIDRQKDELRGLRDDLAKAKAEAKTLQNTLDESRKITQEREALLNRIASQCGGGWSHLPDAVKHLRERADKALELEESVEGLKGNVRHLEIELTKRGNDLSEARGEAREMNARAAKLEGEIRQAKEDLSREQVAFKRAAEEVVSLTTDRDRLQIERDQARASAEALGMEVDALTEEASQVPALRTSLALCLVALIPTSIYCFLHWFGGVK